MLKDKIIQSPNPAIDTFKCPKCGAIWRAEGFYDFDLGGWIYDIDDEYCPCDCRNILGFRIKGQVTKN
jgi:hypothetical protein